jgi:ornithine carbamoyltransferase
VTRHLLALTDLSAPEMKGLLTRAIELKALQSAGKCPHPLQGKTLAMIFEKASTRTRVSFEVGTYQLGGHALMLSKGDLQIGRGESVSDTARVLSRYVDGIMIRTFGHRTIEALAGAAEVPVINGLTDKLHPCQILADLQTIQEAFGAGCLDDLSVAWIGDGNNMAHSWINASAVLGFELRVASPDGYEPRVGVVDAARARGARLVLTHDPREAAAGARVITTDVWASMGQEAEAKAREAAFGAAYQVDDDMMALAADDAIFLHCLPAHRGEEVSASVIDGPRSRVWDEAENRLHAQKAVLEWLMGGRSPA